MAKINWKGERFMKQGLSRTLYYFNFSAAAIALWFCLHLPSCGPGFESQANHLHFFQFVLKL